MIKAIICVDKQGGIGQNGDMPWGRSFPKDLTYFKKVTSGDIVLMGRKTFESLGRPRGLPNRENWVVSTQQRTVDLSSVSYGSPEEFLGWYKEFLGKDTLWIIGGASIYKQFADLIDEWHITTIDNVYPDADTFFQIDLTNFEDTLQCTQVGNKEFNAEVRVYRRKR